MEQIEQFLQVNSPDGGLFQSEQWRLFQESVGRESFVVEQSNFFAMTLVHELPIAGKYFYVPRGPIVDRQLVTDNQQQIKEGMRMLIETAREKGMGWIRIEPANEDILEAMREVCEGCDIVKAPHDVQPREIFRIALDSSEEALLANMKSKTRYNIRLAEKKGVRIVTDDTTQYRDAFVRLVREMAFRKKLTPHPEVYYRKMLDAFLGQGGTLYTALHEDDILAASLVIDFGGTATYLHGGLGEKKRESMAPYLLQWEAIRAAKRAGKQWYDFGGVSKEEYDAAMAEGKWYGITKFKFGFSPQTPVISFPGSYDIVLDRRLYGRYNKLRLARESYVYLRKFMGM